MSVLTAAISSFHVPATVPPSEARSSILPCCPTATLTRASSAARRAFISTSSLKVSATFPERPVQFSGKRAEKSPLRTALRTGRSFEASITASWSSSTRRVRGASMDASPYRDEEEQRGSGACGDERRRRHGSAQPARGRTWRPSRDELEARRGSFPWVVRRNSFDSSSHGAAGGEEHPPSLEFPSTNLQGWDITLVAVTRSNMHS